MSKLYLYCEDSPYGIFNKKNYLLRAAERLGLQNVIELTLPLHPYLTKKQVKEVIKCVQEL